MSDYQVTLVNNKMSEFFVKFHGPSESESILTEHPLHLYLRPAEQAWSTSLPVQRYQRQANNSAVC